ncbi:hypothetical protein PRIPAC_88120 [Pristionchus pacificus]|nr:hypothetical protein PRIPAC_88120 [Pristionchus pacificus]
MGENLMRMHHRKQILCGATHSSQSVRQTALQRGLAGIIRDSEDREKIKNMDGESMEMRLLTEQLNRRLETKFERSHEMDKERERNETERRLRQIGESYEREIRAKEKNMERERSLMMERLDEREKKMIRDIELKMADRESRLELERRRLENRLDELLNGKEEWDRARKELMNTVETEMERLRLEKEGLQERERKLLRDEKMNNIVDGIEEERQRNQGRIAYLEATVSQLRERLHKSEEERKDAHANVSSFEAIKAELSVAKNNYLRQLEESRRLGERLRERDDYEEIRMDNERLKIEIRSSRRKGRCEEERERLKNETREKLEIEEGKSKEKELKIIISMMSEKIRGLTTERDYLRKECKELRKERIEDKKREKKMIEKKNETKTRQLSLLSEGEEDVSVISSFSSFEEDITNIKKRINKIDHLSHELEETLHAVCILPNPERILRERGRRSEEYEENYSHFQYSDREKREDRIKKKMSNISSSSSINRYELEEKISERNKIPVQKPYESEGRRDPFPMEEKKDSENSGNELRREKDNTRIGDETKEKEKERDTNKKEDTESGMNMEGIDPVMAHYMKLVMEGRKKEKDEEKEVAIRSKVEEKEEEEIEEYKLDAVERGGDDDGFEW